MITIVNYNMGNLRSVKNALEFLGYKVQISGSPDIVAQSSILILPGVGSFRTAMETINNSGLYKALNEAVVVNRRPILGICLGMQLLANQGTEDGVTEGFGWIPGMVKKFSFQDSAVRLPHIGFNTVTFTNEAGKLATGLGKESDFYFVHNYHFICDNEEHIAGVSDYNGEFIAVVRNGNVWGTQFHPEKSQFNGLRLLKNFMEMYSNYA